MYPPVLPGVAGIGPSNIMNLLVVTGVFPPDSGGPATYLDNLTRTLHREGWNIRVITTGNRTDSAPRSEFPFPVHRVPRGFFVRTPQSLSVILKNRRWADRIYLNGLEYDATLGTVFSSVPVIQKVVCDRSWERAVSNGRLVDLESFQDERHGLVTRLERAAQKFVIRRSNRVITPSHYLKGILEDWGIPEEKISVIHNGAYPPEELPEETIEWPGPGLKILLAGRVIPLKRFPEILDQIAELPDTSAVVLGEGPDLDRCRSVVHERGLSDRVRFEGRVSRERVFQHLRAADLFVLNSIHETFPHVVLEALASGCPVLAPRVGGIPEIKDMLNDYVTLFDPHDKSELHDLLRDRSFPDRFDPPAFPAPLRWETIKKDTQQVLRDPHASKT